MSIRTVSGLIYQGKCPSVDECLESRASTPQTAPLSLLQALVVASFPTDSFLKSFSPLLLIGRNEKHLQAMFPRLIGFNQQIGPHKRLNNRKKKKEKPRISPSFQSLLSPMKVISYIKFPQFSTQRCK